MGLNDRADVLRPYNGTAYLTPGTRHGTYSTWIRLQCDGIFSLLSVNLAEYSTAYSESNVVFIGHVLTGESVTNIFTLDEILDGPDGVNDFESFTFSDDFRNLSRVTLPVCVYP